MIIFRAATLADTESITRMAVRFQRESEYATHLRSTEATLRAMVYATLTNPDAVVFLAEARGLVVGMLAAALAVQPMSQELVGHEVCWWVDPEVRGGRAAIQLLRRAEGWAADRGAKLFQMMAPNAHVGAFYERLGYVPIETHYQRRLAA